MAEKSNKVVLDIGASAIKLCELKKTPKGLVLSKYQRLDLKVDPDTPPEQVREIKVLAIRQLLKSAKIKKKRSIFAVPGQSAFIRNQLLPPVPETKVSQIVNYVIQQQIPFPIDQIALDYQILKRTEAKEFEVMMVAIKVDAVEGYADIITNSKLKIDTVDVTTLATYNWLRYCDELSQPGEVTACIDLGAGTTELFIEKEGELRFNRNLNLGGNHLTDAIRKELEIPFVEAEQLKIDHSSATPDIGEAQGEEAETAARVQKAIAPVLQRLAGELVRSIGFYRTQPEGGPVTRVVLCGGGAGMKNIVPFLSERLGVEVRVANVLKSVSLTPASAAAQNDALTLTVALGLALRTVEACPIEINLIPPRIVESEKRREKGVYWALSILALLLLGGAQITTQKLQYGLDQDQVNTLDATLASYGSFEEQKNRLSNELTDLKARVEFLNYLTTSQRSYMKPMEWIVSDLPASCWLNRYATVKVKKDQDENQLASPAAALGLNAASGLMGGGLMGGGPRGRMRGPGGGPPMGMAAMARMSGSRGGMGSMGSMVTGSGQIQDPPNALQINGVSTEVEDVTVYVEKLRNRKAFEKIIFDPTNLIRGAGSAFGGMGGGTMRMGGMGMGGRMMAMKGGMGGRGGMGGPMKGGMAGQMMGLGGMPGMIGGIGGGGYPGAVTGTPGEQSFTFSIWAVIPTEEKPKTAGLGTPGGPAAGGGRAAMMQMLQQRRAAGQ